VESGFRRERLTGWVDPATAFTELFRDAEYCFWLDRGPSGISLMGRAGSGASVVTARVGTGTVTRRGAHGDSGVELDESLFDFLRRQQRNVAGVSAQFTDGWIGWLGYEAGADAAGAPTAPSRYPDAALMYVDRSVAFDPLSKAVTLTAREGDETSEWMAQTRAALERVRLRPPLVAPPVQPPTDGAHVPSAWRHDDATYREMVRACQASIVRGDAYVLCLTNELQLAARIDPIAAYRALRAANPTAHGGLVRFGSVWLVSASPEQFLRVTADGAVISRPIKGTRPRGANRADDERLRAQLATSDKERAENLLIVDLMRNDLSRIAQLGTVEVRRLFEVETYAQVHQLVSTVRAQLADGFDAIDAVLSCFPAGSMTGTPKLSAMTILHQLEGGARGIYSGCFGLFSSDGAVDLSMVIRSVVVDESGVSIGAGGGITSLSNPDDELAEVKLKAALLESVVRASLIH